MLSVLLSAFGFFIVHDYVIADVDADTQYELCYSQEASVTLDLPSQIHEHIHVLLSVPASEPSLPGSLPVAAREQTAGATPHSYISPTPTRPPLA